MKTKQFVFLGFLIILAVLSGCSFLTGPDLEKNNTLVINIGSIAPDGSRATFSPEFNPVALTTFEKITLEVQGVGIIYKYNSTDPGQTVGAQWTVSLENVPYGQYTIKANAFMKSTDLETANVATGTITHNFSNSNPYVNITLNVINNSGNGTLRYTLNNPDQTGGTPLTANLNTFVTSPSFKLNPYGSPLTIDGAVHEITGIPSGFYILTFGNMTPSVVHIYKDLVTVATETNDIFNLSAVSPDPESVFISLSREGLIREGTVITATMSGQYVPDSIKLNGGADNKFLSGGADTNLDPTLGIFTRQFTMPSKSVVVGAEKGLTPGIEVDFEDPSNHENLRFWSVASSPAIITSAAKGQEITVRAHASFDPPAGEMPVSVMVWYLDSEIQAVSSSTFTVPSGTTASRVGAMVFLNGAVYSIDIDIVQ